MDWVIVPYVTNAVRYEVVTLAACAYTSVPPRMAVPSTSATSTLRLSRFFSRSRDPAGHRGGYGFRLPPCRIQDLAPDLPVFGRDGPFDVFGMRVEEQDERIVGDRPAAIVRRLDRPTVQKDSQRACVTRLPVLVGHGSAGGLEPTDIHGAADRPALEPAPAAKDRVIATQRDEPAGEGEQSRVDRSPVHPRQLAVLAVRVVVADLSPSKLVPGEQHGYSLGQKERG